MEKTIYNNNVVQIKNKIAKSLIKKMNNIQEQADLKKIEEYEKLGHENIK